MILYKGGKLIQNIEDLIEGENYCIGGIGGVFKRASNQWGQECFQFKATKEGTLLFLDRQALIDRIQLGIVRRVLSASKPRQKTMQKLLKK